MSAANGRYEKLARFAPVGESGLARLAAASVAVLGCGALGALAAEQLARSGVGRVRLIDRDFVELSNLQRQVLFTEADAAAGLPKVIAAKRQLNRVNAAIEIDAEIADFTADTAARLSDGIDLVVDCTDNLETRYLLNEVCLDGRLPWTYGGCVGGSGMAALFVPGGPCLRCVFPERPPAGEVATCDSAGIIASAAHAVASVQTSLAIRQLIGDGAAVASRLAVLNVWDLSFRTVRFDSSGPCPTCGDGERPFRCGEAASAAVTLCGRNAVQIDPGADTPPVDLPQLAKRLATTGRVTTNPYLVRWTPVAGELSLTAFADGRTVVHGTTDPAAARAFLARSVGA